MKYLWIRPRQAFLLMVRIKFKHSRKWAIPIPIWVLEETLQALHDIAWVWEKIARVFGRNGENNQQWIKYIARMPVSSTLKIGCDILRDLRRYGRFRMVEVQDREIQVYVDMY